jgi:hypothetical protein
MLHVSNALRHEVAIAVAQGGTVKYQDDERAVVEIRARQSVLTLAVGTVLAFLLPGLIGALLSGVDPLLGGVIVLGGTVGLLVYVWRPSSTTWELWLEDGEVKQRKAA